MSEKNLCPMTLEQMKAILVANGYNYGDDAAENALVGYELALLTSYQSEYKNDNPAACLAHKWLTELRGYYVLPKNGEIEFVQRLMDYKSGDGALPKPNAYLVPHLMTFKGVTRTSCLVEHQKDIEGTVGWSAEMFSDANPVTDKYGVVHHVKPLFAIEDKS